MKVLLPIVPGFFLRDPSPALESIKIDVLRLFWPLRTTERVEELEGVGFTDVRMLLLDPRAYDDPMLSREIIRVMITPYVTALREVWLSSIWRMKLFH